MRLWGHSRPSAALTSTRPHRPMAAAYWAGLGRNHAFLDGNKRIGLNACDVFLLMNGYELTFTVDQAIDYTLAIVTGKADREEAAIWIEQNVRRL